LVRLILSGQKRCCPVVFAVHLKVQHPNAQRLAGVRGRAQHQSANPAATIAFLDVEFVHEGVTPVELETVAEGQGDVPGRRAAEVDEPHPAGRMIRQKVSRAVRAAPSAKGGCWWRQIERLSPSRTFTSHRSAALKVGSMRALPLARIDLGESIRANLLSFLVSVAEASQQAGLGSEELERMAAFDIKPFLDTGDDEALYGNEDAANSFYARALFGCIRVAPALMKAMLEGLTDASPRIRACAAMGAVTLARTEALRNHAKKIESQWRALAQAAPGSDERSAHALALGDLGFSPNDFLEDPSSAVRMCAALAPSLVANPAAISELLNTLEHHAGDIDDWFAEKPPQFAMRPRFPVVARLIQQVKDFDRLANVAIAVVGVTAKSCVDFD
jgi:hypothetical protein